MTIDQWPAELRLASRRLARTKGFTGVATDEETVLTEGFLPQFAESGHIVFWRNTSIWAVPFDLERLALAGDPVRLIDGVQNSVSIANDGTLAYLTGQPETVQLVWVDQDGLEQTVAGAPAGRYFEVALSPDGGRVALTVASDSGFVTDIFVYDLARQTLTQVTTDPGLDLFPLWTPDGRDLVISSSRAGVGRNLFRRAADGSGQVERLTTSSSQQSAWDWSKDGTTLVFQEVSTDTGWDIFTAAVDDMRDPVPMVQTASGDTQATVAPDGQWVAYGSGGQVYVSPFPNVSEFREQVSTSGGGQPRWSTDGETLFYRVGAQVMAARVETQRRLSIGVPAMLFEGGYARGAGGKGWDVAADGRFLMMKTNPAQPSINVITNWFEELTERVPVP